MIIQSMSAVVDARLVGETWIEVSENLIRSVNSGVNPTADQIIGGTLIPGFIDIHCHGGAGSYFSNASRVQDVLKVHREHGTTGIIASLVTESIEDLKVQIAALVPFYKSGHIL